MLPNDHPHNIAYAALYEHTASNIKDLLRDILVSYLDRADEIKVQPVGQNPLHILAMIYPNFASTMDIAPLNEKQKKTLFDALQQKDIKGCTPADYRKDGFQESMTKLSKRCGKYVEKRLNKIAKSNARKKETKTDDVEAMLEPTPHMLNVTIGEQDAGVGTSGTQSSDDVARHSNKNKYK